MCKNCWKKPDSGVVELEVCSESGQLLTDACGDNKTTQVYLEGTEPTEPCPIHSSSGYATLAISRLKKEKFKSGESLNVTLDTSPLSFNIDFLDDDYIPPVKLPDSFFDEKEDVTSKEEEKEVDYNIWMD